jgi:hypothetical protein
MIRVTLDYIFDHAKEYKKLIKQGKKEEAELCEINFKKYMESVDEVILNTTISEI